MEHILQNLQNGDITTGLMVAGVAVAIFFFLKFITSIFKAMLIMVVIVVAIAVIYPQSHIVDKVQKGTKVAIEKGKAITQQVQKSAAQKGITLDSIKQSIKQ